MTKSVLYSVTTPWLLKLIEYYLQDNGDDIVWDLQNDLQRQALEIAAEMSNLGSQKILRGFASKYPEKLKSFFLEAGLNIELNWTPAPGAFGVAAVFSIKRPWNPGGAGRASLGEYAGFKLNSKSGMKVVGKGANAIFKVPFADGFVHIKQMPNLQIASPLDLHFVAKQMATEFNSGSPDSLPNGLHLPSVRYKHVIKSDDALKWLTGPIGSGGGTLLPVIITKAVEQAELLMNETGITGEAGSAAAVMRSTTEPYTIQDPFVVSLWLNNLPFPLEVGWFAPDSWVKG